MESPGEFELIARLTGQLTTRPDVALGVGDDCAILDLPGPDLLLLTCDSQVEGVHFSLETASPEQVGRKALAINLSDIAAMGGEPRYALISLILPRQLSFTLLDGIYAGLRQEAERYATAIVGGNISGAGKGEQLIIDITLVGAVERNHALVRSGARVGDILCVTGTLGNSAAAFYTLLHADQHYSQDALNYVWKRHFTPQPRIPEGRVLSQFGPGVVTAMLDISDGLSGDLGHICERSGVGARIELARLPLSPQMRLIAAQAERDPLEWALHGGEEYELLFTVSPDHQQAVSQAVLTATGTPVTKIGVIRPAEEGMRVVSAEGRQEVLKAQSWDHLRGPGA
ncbi:MAG TPA: thiamine-phosphate kinase [Ktedonosporobacter sp.]|jgi:thiamine-monophosphate kinase|nr:thiamine-phosphate kinase [Ktedonosporobacter sp.]